MSSSYDKIADILMNTPSDQVTLKFDDVQGLLREFRERQFALEATLLFHSGAPWDTEKKSKWYQITKSYEATTKVMCDHIRRVLGLPDTSESPTGRLNVETKPAMQNIKPTCKRCGGTGIVETGNNDLPCRECPAGQRALFSTGNGREVEPGEEVIKTLASPANWWPIAWGPKPDGWRGIAESTIRELERLQDRREEVRRKLDAGEITREDARREFPESY